MLTMSVYCCPTLLSGFFPDFCAIMSLSFIPGNLVMLNIYQVNLNEAVCQLLLHYVILRFEWILIDSVCGIQFFHSLIHLTELYQGSPIRCLLPKYSDLRQKNQKWGSFLEANSKLVGALAEQHVTSISLLPPLQRTGASHSSELIQASFPAGYEEACVEHRSNKFFQRQMNK